MSETVIVWDLETVPDLAAAGRMLHLPDAAEQEIREAMGSGFPKHPLHKIACIGALVAELQDSVWQLRALGAPHIGERSEADLISGFVNEIAELRPQLVSFNGSSFDLPVLRYRAMLNHVSAPGLGARPYFNRYTEDALDLCDALSSFDARSRVKLDELCRVMGLTGKPEGIDGSQVADMVADGHIADVAAYCESDVVNTYQVWLRYRLFRGSLPQEAFHASNAALHTFISAQLEKKPHLSPILPASFGIVAAPLGASAALPPALTAPALH